ncbi:MAG: MoxR family ATPase, partial [Casimicrobiaceae bacterium]
EAMEERQVTVGGTTHKLPPLFLVMATQNPIEQEGTYPLPEAQVDRFMMKLHIDYPSREEERQILDRMATTGEPIDVGAVATTEQLADLQKECRRVYVDPNLINYAVRLVAATREPERFGLKDFGRFLTFGASPRATIHMIEGAKALAFLRGRTYVLPEDVTDIVPDVMRHRLVLSYEALAEGQSPDMLIRKVMQQIAAPSKPLETHVRVANA